MNIYSDTHDAFCQKQIVTLCYLWIFKLIKRNIWNVNKLRWFKLKYGCWIGMLNIDQSIQQQVSSVCLQNVTQGWTSFASDISWQSVVILS